MNSPQANLDLLFARVQKLEASNRRWRLLNAALLLTGVSVALMGAKPADRLEPNVIRAGTVEAQEFTLKDTDGHVYARLSLGGTSANILANGLNSLPNQNGLQFMPNRVTPSQPALQFFDDRGNVVWTVPQEPTLRPAK
ncbi:MAG TPA: hypothetical protein VJO16_01160 [Candidatus Acidoferrum sp.]|nr:hypothetical protein [Candidatus Acidoferrum sp.]